VIGYPLLERFHWLLVAGFDVCSNVGHQWLSRLYMDFLRMEGEFNFLSFLPSEQRLAVRDSSVLRERRGLLLEENTLSVARGFVGAYPNAQGGTVAEAHRMPACCGRRRNLLPAARKRTAPAVHPPLGTSSRVPAPARLRENHSQVSAFFTPSARKLPWPFRQAFDRVSTIWFTWIS
jgi:hypothetical protein